MDEGCKGGYLLPGEAPNLACPRDGPDAQCCIPGERTLEFCTIHNKNGTCLNVNQDCADKDFKPHECPNWPGGSDKDMQCCLKGTKRPEECALGIKKRVCLPTNMECTDTHFEKVVD